ncbi:MAG: sigma 54-interacting transcriptional regulator, partial [Deltaproteobacteria bacterium]|nr:sigma 54-interacting transcriptional regulator [Deltaproteobacteria bacterium]
MTPRRPLPGLEARTPGQVVSFGGIITRNPQLKQLMTRIGRIAATDLNMLLVGETGTGKELIARHIHAQSGRRSQPFVAVDCGTINRNLFESAFFGYERGGFTGADTRGRK